MVRTRRLTANLTVDSYTAWQDFAASRGVNVTALLEALGRHLGNFDGRRLPPLLADSVTEARAVQVERRRRRTD